MDGSFRRKESFTVVQNSVVRDKGLPLKAKGLYMIIQSYITMPDKIWHKSEFLGMCVEGQKAFDSAWCMLKEAGYLKVHMKSTGATFEVEYELLDEKKEGPHTFYYNSAGQLTRTNLSRTPQNGSNGNGSNGNGSNGNGGNNNQELSDEINNNNSNNHSIGYAGELKKIGTGTVEVIDTMYDPKKKPESLFLQETLRKIRRPTNEINELAFAIKSLCAMKEEVTLRGKTYVAKEIIAVLLMLSEEDLLAVYEKVLNRTRKYGPKSNQAGYLMACLAGETDYIKDKASRFESGLKKDLNAIVMERLVNSLN